MSGPYLYNNRYNQNILFAYVQNCSYPLRLLLKFPFGERVYFSSTEKILPIFLDVAMDISLLLLTTLGINRVTMFYSFLVAVDHDKDIWLTEDLCFVQAYSRSECYNAILKRNGSSLSIVKRIIHKHMFFKTVGILSDHSRKFA